MIIVKKNEVHLRFHRYDVFDIRFKNRAHWLTLRFAQYLDFLNILLTYLCFDINYPPKSDAITKYSFLYCLSYTATGEYMSCFTKLPLINLQLYSNLRETKLKMVMLSTPTIPWNSCQSLNPLI